LDSIFYDEAADTILVDKLKMFLSDIQSYQQYSKDHPVYQTDTPDDLYYIVGNFEYLIKTFLIYQLK
jgi:ATP-dependent helicase/nuclease subunit A